MAEFTARRVFWFRITNSCDCGAIHGYHEVEMTVNEAAEKDDPEGTITTTISATLLKELMEAKDG